MATQREIVQLTHDNVAAPIGAPEVIGAPDPQTPETPQQEQGAEPKGKGPIPYERFEQVTRQNQEMRNKLMEMEEKIKAVSVPGEKLAELEARKREEQEYWKNPFEYERREKERLSQQFQEFQGKLQENLQFENIKSQFKSSPEYTPELENKMVDYIRAHELNALPNRSNAVKAAYEAVTGRKFGEWQAGNYQTTRQLKERLTRAGSGGAKVPAMTEEDFDNVSPEEYEKNPQKYNEQLAAYMASLQP